MQRELRRVPCPGPGRHLYRRRQRARQQPLHQTWVKLRSKSQGVQIRDISDELQHALGLTCPRAVFFSCSTQDAVLEALRESPWARSAPPLLVRMPDGDGEEEEEEGLLTLGQLMASVPQPAHFTPYKPKDPSDCVALIMCSSGTTGLPKGVAVTQMNILVGLSNRM